MRRPSSSRWPATTRSPSTPRAGAHVDGARDELHRLVLNLMENALRHTDPGTAVEATVERRNGEVVLAVEDDGPGIPDDQREKVFERFYRGSGEHSGSSGPRALDRARRRRPRTAARSGWRSRWTAAAPASWSGFRRA